MSTDIVTRALTDPKTIEQEYLSARQRLTAWAVSAAQQIPGEMGVDEAKNVFEVLGRRSQLHADGELLTRFLMGVATFRVKVKTKYGEDVVGALADYYRSRGYPIHANTLRYYVAAARKFGCNVQLFDEWLRTGTPKRQYHVIELTRAHEDPEVLGAEEFARVIEDKVLRAAEATSRLSDPVQRHEVELILTEAALQARDHFLTQERDPIVDESTGEVYESLNTPEAFKSFVMMLNCMACGSPPPPGGANDPHHVDSGNGKAMKGSDWTQVPLCRRCHTLAESVPAGEFERRKGVHLGAAVARVLHIWVSGRDVPSLTTRY